MLPKKRNRSDYQYNATYCIWRDNGSEDDCNWKLDTDISYNGLHFWNRPRILKKYQKELLLEVKRDRHIMCFVMLKEELVLVNCFIYEF